MKASFEKTIRSFLFAFISALACALIPTAMVANDALLSEFWESSERTGEIDPVTEAAALCRGARGASLREGRPQSTVLGPVLPRPSSGYVRLQPTSSRLAIPAALLGKVSMPMRC